MTQENKRIACIYIYFVFQWLISWLGDYENLFLLCHFVLWKVRAGKVYFVWLEAKKHTLDEVRFRSPQMTNPAAPRAALSPMVWIKSFCRKPTVTDVTSQGLLLSHIKYQTYWHNTGPMNIRDIGRALFAWWTLTSKSKTLRKQSFRVLR